MRRKVEFVLLILLLAGLIVVSRNLGNYVSSGKIKRAKNTVVIDAGHGGSDPGKVGINKAEEKEINLKIAKKVKKILEKKGVKVVMTREEGKINQQHQTGICRQHPSEQLSRRSNPWGAGILLQTLCRGRTTCRSHAEGIIIY